MNRRGFLGRAGAAAAAGAATFLPHVVEASKTETLPVATTDPKDTIINLKTGERVVVVDDSPSLKPGHSYVFTSKYRFLRVQIRADRAVQFQHGRFQTDDMAVANALLAAASRRQSPYQDLWEPVPVLERDPRLVNQIRRG